MSRPWPRIALLVPFALQVPQAGPADLAIVGAHVIPMDQPGRVLRDQTVVIRAGRIVAVGRRGVVEVPAGVRIIEARGQFLIPGFTDAHVHFRIVPDTGATAGLNRDLLRMYLAYGVTRVLHMGAFGNEGFVADLRRQVLADATPGPRIAIGYQFVRRDASADDGRRVVDEVLAQGYDFVKSYTFVSADGYRAMTDAARERGVRVIGHLPRALGLDTALTRGQEMIAHAEELLYVPPFRLLMSDPPDVAPQLDTADIPVVVAKLRRHGTWVTPTLSAYTAIAGQTEDVAAFLARTDLRPLPATLANEWRPEANPIARRASEPMRRERTRLSIAFQRRLIRALHQGGVPLLAGTDAAIPGIVPGADLHTELELLVGVGLGRYEALATATANPGRFFRDGIGTIAPGVPADLVLLSANPLDDIRNTRSIRTVIARGRPFRPSDLWPPS